MDPLSIAAAAAGLATLCVQTAAVLDSWINQVKHVDEEVESFADEIQTYSRILSSIDQNLRRPNISAAVQQDVDGRDLWKIVLGSLSNCTNTVRELYDLLIKFQSTADNVIKQVFRTIQLNRNSDAIVRLRRRLLAYKDTMQLALHIFLIIDNQGNFASLEDRITVTLQTVQTNLEETRTFQEALVALQNAASSNADASLQGHHDPALAEVRSGSEEPRSRLHDFAENSVELPSHYQTSTSALEEATSEPAIEQAIALTELNEVPNQRHRAISISEMSTIDQTGLLQRDCQAYEELTNVLEAAKSTVAASSLGTEISSVSSHISMSIGTLNAIDRWIWAEDGPSLASWVKVEARAQNVQPVPGRYNKRKGYSVENLNDLCDEIDQLCLNPSMRPIAASFLKAFFDHMDRGQQPKTQQATSRSLVEITSDLTDLEGRKSRLMKKAGAGSQSQKQIERSLQETHEEYLKTKRLEELDYDSAMKHLRSALISPARLEPSQAGVLSVGENGFSLFQFLVSIDRFDFLTVLYRRGSNPAAKLENRFGPLHAAAICGRSEFILFLIEQGMDANDVDEYGNTPLMEACRHSNDIAAQILLTHTTDILAQTKDCNLSALHLAIRKGLIETAALIVSSLPQDRRREVLLTICEEGSAELVNAVFQDNEVLLETIARERDPLLLVPACERGEVEIIKLLFGFGFSIDSAAFPEDAQLLDLVVQSGQQEAIKLVLERDRAHFILSTTKDNRTSLHLACQVGLSEEMFQWVLDASVNKIPRDDHGLTPLHIAVQHGRIDLANLLFQVDAYQVHDDRLHSLLFALAVESGSISTLEWMLRFESSNGYPKNTLATPLKRMLTMVEDWSRLDSDQQKLFQQVCHDSAMLSVFLCCEDQTLLTRPRSMLLYTMKNALDVEEQLLVDAGANINATAEHSLSLLHLAVLESHRRMLERLLRYHPNLEARDVFGRTPLLLATSCLSNPFQNESSLQIYKLLLKAGADTNAQDHQLQTVLHTACHNFYFSSELLVLLLQYGADVHRTTVNGDSALHVVARSKNPQATTLAKRLLDVGADPDAVNISGKIPAQVAASANASTDMIKLLESKSKRWPSKTPESDSNLPPEPKQSKSKFRTAFVLRRSKN